MPTLTAPSRAFRFPLRLSAALLAALFALVVAVPTALAGPASLSASPTPVVIAYGKTTGMTTVSWNSGSNTVPVIYVSINGGAEALDPELNHDVTTKSGTGELTVTYGNTYTLRLYTPGKGQLLATTVVTTKRPDLVAPGACLMPCVVVTPGGISADFAIESAVAQQFVLTASTQAPKPDHTFDHVDSATFSWGPKTDWPTHLLSLQPGTLYHYVLKATDAQGTVRWKEGSFSTLSRRVHVEFHKVRVSDDSDDLSQGEISFRFEVNGASFTTGEYHVSSGHAAYPKVHFVRGAGTTLTLKAFGVDDDTTIGSCAWWECGDHAQGSAIIDLAGMEGGDSRSFTIIADGASLSFTVEGSVTVSYGQPGANQMWHE